MDRLWGWDKLLPIGDSVSKYVYSNYLEAYYLRTKTPPKSLSLADIAETVSELRALYYATDYILFLLYLVSVVVFANLNCDDWLCDCMMVSSSVASRRKNLCLSARNR